MTDFPARRIDDRELRPELALAGEIVRDAPGVVPRCPEPGSKLFHKRKSSE
jgi:hypothetical protein